MARYVYRLHIYVWQTTDEKKIHGVLGAQGGISAVCTRRSKGNTDQGNKLLWRELIYLLSGIALIQFHHYYCSMRTEVVFTAGGLDFQSLIIVISPIILASYKIRGVSLKSQPEACAVHNVRSTPQAKAKNVTAVKNKQKKKDKKKQIDIYLYIFAPSNRNCLSLKGQ